MYTTDYSQMTVGDLYQSTRGLYKKESTTNFARAWVMAENIMEVRNLIIDWCDALNDGSIKHRLPDPFNKMTQNEADKLIKILDDEFDYEFRNRASNLGVEKSVDLSERLSSSQRLAMAQAIRATKKSRSQIATEVRERQKAGEVLPPQGWTHQTYFGQTVG